jgi:hypothetical protein
MTERDTLLFQKSDDAHDCLLLALGQGFVPAFEFIGDDHLDPRALSF